MEDALERLDHAMETRSDVAVLYVLHHGCTDDVIAAIRDYLLQCYRVVAFFISTHTDGRFSL